MTAKIRFLVMNRTNQVIAPRDEQLAGYIPAELKASGDIPKKFSPSFTNEAKARGFAEALALKYGGENFYVSKVIAGVSTATVNWSEAVPVTALADTNLAADDDGLDDGSDNE